MRPFFSILATSSLLGLGAIFFTTPASAAIAFVQVNKTVLSTTVTSATIPYTAAQNAGDLNVVIIGWEDAIANIVSVTDTKGNSYALAVGTTRSPGNNSLAMYYAKNIAAATTGANTVTVTFNTGAPLPDIRIAEYSGIDTISPLDASNGATGSGTAVSTAAMTTTAANELIVGGDQLANSTNAVGTGFTQRVLTSHSHVLEDRIVTATGSYAVSATQTAGGYWTIVGATFRAAVVDTQAPTAPSGLTATAASPSRINLSWTASTDNVGVAGYRVERCQGAGCSSFAQTATATTTTFSDTGLSASTSYSYRIRAADSIPNLSGYSNTASATTSAGGGAAGIAYKQSNAAVPSTPQTTVSVPFSSAQTAGNLNVVVVGWRNSTSAVTSVTDTRGNSYTRAIGPTVSAGNATQSIYYAKNIAASSAATNAVAVTFNGAVPFADVRVGEYAGVDTTNPVDVVVGASGSSATANSGLATTTNASDLLIAANYSGAAATAAGANYTSRIITNPNGDILQDRVVTGTGSFAAAVPLASSSYWVMQTVAFKAAAAGAAPASSAVVYEYDETGRFKSALFSDGRKTAYSLDAAGNRKSVTTATDSTPPDQPPGALSFTNITPNSATANWGPAHDNFGITGYDYRLNGGAWQSLANVLSVNLTGLTIETNYTFDVRAHDAIGLLSGVTSGAFKTIGDVTPPSSPGAVTITNLTSASATATWGAATDDFMIAGYDYRLGTTGAWTQLGNVLTVNLTGLAPLTSYTFQVRARDGEGLTSVTPQSKAFSTPNDSTPPTPPGAISITSISAHTVTATWGASTDNIAVAGYEYDLDGGLFTDMGNVLTKTITGLQDAHTYTLGVRAYDVTGLRSTTTTSAPFTTTDATPPGPPGTPTFASITATSATASWTVATDNVAVTGYEYTINGGTTWTQVAATVHSVNLTGLTPATSYTFAVRAFDAVALRGTQASAVFSTVDPTAPTQPGTPTFTNLTSTSVTVNWALSTDNIAVTGYEYTLNGGVSWTAVTAPPVGLTGLSEATSYTIAVRAFDGAGNRGLQSSASFATPDVHPPSAPGAPSITNVTGSSATATWTVATDNVAVTGYEWTINGGTTWTQVAASVHSVNLTGLASATTYTISVRAFDAATLRGPQASTTFSTGDEVAPTVPGTPTITGLTGTSATATWGASSDNVAVTGYEWTLDGGSTWNAVSNTTLSVTLSLTPATGYTFTVRARDAVGNRSGTSSVSFNTPDTIPPSAPGFPLFSNVTATSATVTWGVATDNVAVTRYEYTINGGVSWINTGLSTSVALTGLTTATFYNVSVRAYDAAGLVGPSVTNGFQTIDIIPPSAPGPITFSSLQWNSVQASWGAATDNIAVLQYRYSTNGGATWINNGSQTGVFLSGLNGSTTYTLSVQAGDAANNWGPSTSNSFTTPPPSEQATMTVGQLSVYFGYSNGTSYGTFGAYSPTALVGGRTVTLFVDVVNPFGLGSAQVSIAGFSSDPGSSWLIQAFANGIGLAPATGSYSYSAGTATWTWVTSTSTTPFGLFNKSGTAVTAILTHR